MRRARTARRPLLVAFGFFAAAIACGWELREAIGDEWRVIVIGQDPRDVILLVPSARVASLRTGAPRRCPVHPHGTGLRRYNEAMVHTRTVEVRTQGEGDVVDLTPELQSALAESKVRDGLACAFVVGSTAAITTIEFEPGLVEDLAHALEKLAPRDARYAHEARWSDDNGHSHIRASLLGPSICVPIRNGALTLGTWQQVVLCELDTRSRQRTVTVQIVGD